MKTKTKPTATILEARRQAYSLATWKRANQQKRGGYRPRLYDAGDLGYCVLEWSGVCGGHWVNRWFDRMDTLTGNFPKKPVDSV